MRIEDVLNTVIQGDCLEVMKELPENSVDAIVTDPPYGLKFMGKKWDYDVPKVEVWQEALRVLKPGGHALVACGTRTQHRMACNLEDAGFEIRDLIMWVYGSGFPKSMDISKQIDKMKGEEREVVDSKKRPSGLHRGKIADYSPKNSDNFIPLITIPSSPEAKQWEGWGTALKPAVEIFTLCRKPLGEKTVAENVLKWGTGGINIDECRVETLDILSIGTNKHKDGVVNFGMKNNKNSQTQNSLGRFPANLIHDGSEEVVEVFTRAGESKSNNNNSLSLKTEGYKNWNCFGKFGNSIRKGHSDQGTPARFFYCPKAAKSERNMGCSNLPEKQKIFNGQSEKSSPDMKGVEQKFTTLPQKNNHPTVKPVALIEYLIKLISPENSIILDPFIGSGTTGIACRNLNRSFIGIELMPEYVEIAEARINSVKDPSQLTLF